MRELIEKINNSQQNQQNQQQQTIPTKPYMFQNPYQPQYQYNPQYQEQYQPNYTIFYNCGGRGGRGCGGCGGRAVAATDFANTSIVGRTDCAVTTEENAVTLPKVIKLMRLLRIAWGAIHIM